jgi:hypothetical protein
MVRCTTVTQRGKFPPNDVDDPIHLLLKKLLATEDLVEFDALSLELRTKLHDRVDRLRKEAQALTRNPSDPEGRRRRPKDGGNKP